jgi:hypothetical protein
MYIFISGAWPHRTPKTIPFCLSLFVSDEFAHLWAFSGGADARTAPFNPVVGLFCTVPTKTTHGRNPGKIIFRIPVNRGTGKLSPTVEQGFF